MALNLTISSTRILDDHAEYGISAAVTSSSSNSVVWRRYKDFENLRSAVDKTSRSINVPELPSKHSWWSSRSAEVVNQRQRELELFLRELEACVPRPSQGWTILCQFVGVSPNVALGSSSNSHSSSSNSHSTSSNNNNNTVVTRRVETTREVHRENEDVTNVLREEVLRLQNQLAMLEEEEGKLKIDLANKDTELAALRSKRVDTKQIKEQSTQLEKEKSQLTVEIARLEALVNSSTDAKKELNRIKEEDLKYKNEIAVLEGERNDLQAALVRHEELVDSLRREVARLEEESAKMQEEITTLQRQLQNNPNEENLRSEVNRLKKENGALQLEITRLEQAQQSAAAYGASVLAKLEKVEKEKSEQLAQARMTIEAEAKISGQMRDRLEALQDEVARLELARKDANEYADRVTRKLESVEKERYEYVEQTKIKIEETTTNTKQLQDRLVSLQKEIDRLEKEKQQAASQVETVTVKLQTVEKERYEYMEQTKIKIEETTNGKKQLEDRLVKLEKEFTQVEQERKSALSQLEAVTYKLQNVEKEKHEYIEQAKVRIDAESRNAAQLEKELKMLQQEISRLEQAKQQASSHIESVTVTMETVKKETSAQLEQANIRIEEEVRTSSQLKKEIETIRSEMSQLEKALQGATQYGDNVSLKLERLEKEKNELLEQTRLKIEEEKKRSAEMQAYIQDLEKQLKALRDSLAEANRDLEAVNKQKQELIAANELLQVDVSTEQTELVTLRKEVNTLQERLATIYAEYEILKARSRTGDGELEIKIETLGKQVVEFKGESEKNANIKMKLAARVDALVAENMHLREKNFSLERRLKLLQGD